jgi:hypothetical protein
MGTQPAINRKHVGPGKVVMSLYADKKMREAIKRRAKELGIPVSTYIFNLAKEDIRSGGDLILRPDNPQSNL